MNYIIIVGTPLDGFDFIGPFDDATSALNFAQNNMVSDNWWIKELTEPGEIYASENILTQDIVDDIRIVSASIAAAEKDTSCACGENDEDEIGWCDICHTKIK